jgi:hypothetical protein
MKYVALAAAVIAVTCALMSAAVRAQSPYAASPTPSASPAVAASPDPVLAQRFQAFFADVLADRTPTQNLIPEMQKAMTPAALVPVKQYFASLGTFKQLQYVNADQLGGYRRYHFLATFTIGSQKVMFVLDPAGALAGFFNEP